MKKLKLAILLSIPALTAPVFAQSSASLFGSAPITLKSRANLPGQEFIKQEKSVTVNFKNISPAAASQFKELEVELFDGEKTTLSLDHVEQRSANNYTWHGYVKGSPNNVAMFTVVNNYVIGSLYTSKPGQSQLRHYEIQSDSSGAHSLREIDDSRLPEDHPRTQPVNLKKLGAAPVQATVAASGSLSTAPKKIDVMIVYSNQVAAALGGAIGANVQAAIDAANQTFANSQIQTRARLVYSGSVNYNETTDAGTDINNFAANATVNAQRNASGADVVMALTETIISGGKRVCGLAAAIGAQSNSAIALVGRTCIQASFAHEMGHLFGARHDTFVDATATPYSYGHGYVDKANKVLTVMAYADACTVSGINDCVRYPVFSSPALLLNLGGKQIPIGTAATEDNRRVILENTARLADFFPSKALQETGIYSGALASYTINQSGKNFVVTPSSGPEPVTVFDDTSANRLRFADATIALDIDGSAGNTYRLYQAAFNRAPDAGGLGFWIYQADRGISMVDIAAAFISSGEFTNLYGANPTNAAFVTALYNNVLHRAPDPGGYNFWLNQLNSGIARPDVLLAFSNSQENRDGVAPSLTHGIRYTLYAPGLASSPLNLTSPFRKK